MTDQTHADWLRVRVAELRTISGNYPLMETHREIQRLESIADELEAKERTIAALTAKVAHWKANHAAQVEANRLLRVLGVDSGSRARTCPEDAGR